MLLIDILPTLDAADRELQKVDDVAAQRVLTNLLAVVREIVKRQMHIAKDD